MPQTRPANYHPAAGFASTGAYPRIGAWTGVIPGWNGFGGEQHQWRVVMSIDGDFVYAPGNFTTLQPVLSAWGNRLTVSGGLGGEPYWPLFTIGVAPDGSVGAQVAVWNAADPGNPPFSLLTVRSPAGQVSKSTGAFTLIAALDGTHVLDLNLRQAENGLTSNVPADGFWQATISYLEGNTTNYSPTQELAYGLFANDGGATRMRATIYEAVYEPEGDLKFAWFFDEPNEAPTIPAYVGPIGSDGHWEKASEYVEADPLAPLTLMPDVSAMDLTIAKVPASSLPNGDAAYTLKDAYRLGGAGSFRKILPTRPTYRPITGIEASA